MVVLHPFKRQQSVLQKNSRTEGGVWLVYRQRDLDMARQGAFLENTHGKMRIRIPYTPCTHGYARQRMIAFLPTLGWSKGGL